MTIGVIGAMQMEVDDLKAQMTDTQTEVYSGVEFVEGKIGDQYVVAAKCGIGKVFAAICAEAMILKYDVDMIVDMDTSPIGDPKGLLSGINMILLPADTKMVELMCSCLADRNIHYKKGNIATGDQFIATKEQKDYISNTFDAIAAEMEGGSIGHVCYVNKVPFAILRSISDGDGGETDYQTFAEKAAHQSIEVVLEFIGRAEELK